MLIYANSKNRPFHYGQFPLETLPRDETVISREAARPPLSQPIKKPVEGLLGQSANRYLRIFSQIAEGEPARARAPVPDDLQRRTADIKGLAYFLDAAQVGICRIPAHAWLQGAEKSTHDYAIVFLVEDGRVPEEDNLAHEWVASAVRATTDMRVAEIAVRPVRKSQGRNISMPSVWQF